jgi:hypothetical protein
MKFARLALPIYLGLLLHVFVSPALADRYVYEGFTRELSDFYGDGYGLAGGWYVRTFDPGNINDYALRTGSLTGIGSTDANHLERVQGSGISTIWRDLAEPIGAPGATKYLGFLLHLPDNGQLLPTAVIAGIQLLGNGDGIYAGVGNSAGGKFRLRNLNGGISRTSTTQLVAGQTYFCVLKLEFSENENETTCSLYVGGDDTQPPDATISVSPRSFTSLGVTSNYSFSIDEIRTADSVAELRQTAPTPPSLSATAASFSRLEGNTGTNQIPVTLRLSKASEYAASVGTSLNPTTASADDFVDASTLIKFAPGEIEKTVIVEIIGDTNPEPDEKIFFFLNRYAGMSLGSFVGGAIELNILNDDFAPAEVTMSIEKVGNSCFINWITSSTRLILQQSSDLVQWQDVTPAAFSNESGPLEIGITGDARFYRFGPP